MRFGEPVANAAVTVTDAAGNTFDLRTGPDGTYRLEGSPDRVIALGEVTVTARVNNTTLSSMTTVEGSAPVQSNLAQPKSDGWRPLATQPKSPPGKPDPAPTPAPTTVPTAPLAYTGTSGQTLAATAIALVMIGFGFVVIAQTRYEEEVDL